MEPEKNYRSVFLIIIFATFLMNACQTHEPSGDEAFKKVKEEKKNLVESTEVVPEIKKDIPVKKIEVVDEWTLFKTETEKKISANEVKIKTIKGTPNVNVKLLKRVTILEKENNDLRIQLTDYHNEVQERWLKFKEKINTDLEDMNTEFKDLSPKK